MALRAKCVENHLQETGKVLVDGPDDLKCILLGLLNYCDCREDDERVRLL